MGCFDMSLMVIQRLERLLDERDKEVERLENRLQEWTEKDEVDPNWWRHKEIEKIDYLPVPRLQMELVENVEGRYEYKWVYGIVYRHFLGHHVLVPLGITFTSGNIPSNDLPFRDGAHLRADADHFNFPVFVLRGGTVKSLNDYRGQEE